MGGHQGIRASAQIPEYPNAAMPQCGLRAFWYPGHGFVVTVVGLQGIGVVGYWDIGVLGLRVLNRVFGFRGDGFGAT